MATLVETRRTDRFSVLELRTSSLNQEQQDEDPVLPQLERDSAAFRSDGFTIIDRLISPAFASVLCKRLDDVLRHGDSDLGAPDKVPAFKGETRSKAGKTPPAVSGLPSKKTLQVINVWKADSAFRSLVLSPTLGKLVADLAGWRNGARVANDQVWAKPPGASPLTFHRDSAYFQFTPSHVVTVWIALDDMDEELGPLQYVAGSHLWDDRRCGGTKEFFLSEKHSNHQWMMISAFQSHKATLADNEAQENPTSLSAPSQLEQPALTTVGVRSGGCGVHDGRLWHGSDRNKSKTRARRGLGIHFVPAEARFKNAMGTTLAHKVRARSTSAADAASGDIRAVSPSTDDLPPDLFPVTYRPPSPLKLPGSEYHGERR